MIEASNHGISAAFVTGLAPIPIPITTLFGSIGAANRSLSASHPREKQGIPSERILRAEFATPSTAISSAL